MCSGALASHQPKGDPAGVHRVGGGRSHGQGELPCFPQVEDEGYKSFLLEPAINVGFLREAFVAGQAARGPLLVCAREIDPALYYVTIDSV